MCCHTFSLLHIFPFTFHQPLFSSPLTVVPSITNRVDNRNRTLPFGAQEIIVVTYNRGKPRARVQWSKDEQLIQDHVNVNNRETTLTLRNNGPEVKGKYNVTLRNIFGKDTVEYNVEAECKLMCRYIYLVIHL